MVTRHSVFVSSSEVISWIFIILHEILEFVDNKQKSENNFRTFPRDHLYFLEHKLIAEFMFGIFVYLNSGYLRLRDIQFDKWTGILCSFDHWILNYR